MTRRWVRDLARAALDASVIEVPDAAHACHHGRPQAVADLLLDATRPGSTTDGVGGRRSTPWPGTSTAVTSKDV